jgi:hypothetical protein
MMREQFDRTSLSLQQADFPAEYNFAPYSPALKLKKRRSEKPIGFKLLPP